MRERIVSKLLLPCALAATLAACGGGGGGSGFGSAPPPPAPPPPPPDYIDVFPGITQSTDFAVLGIQAGAFDVPATDLVTNGFAVSFDASSGAYVIDLPSTDPANFIAQSEDSHEWDGHLENTGMFLSILKPSVSNPAIQLSHTSYAEFFEYDYDDFAPAGFVAFGTGTPGAGVPTTGSATYDALVAGLTLDGDATVSGNAILQFDFAAGTLAGYFDPVLLPYTGGSFALGQYAFVNTVFGVGSTTYSGEFSHSNPLLTGAFNGLFTGPNAQELMARWSADFINPSTQQPGEMFGIWVGKAGGP